MITQIDAQASIDAAIAGPIGDRAAGLYAVRYQAKTLTLGFPGIWRPDNRPFMGADRQSEACKHRGYDQHSVHRTLHLS